MGESCLEECIRGAQNMKMEETSCGQKRMEAPLREPMAQQGAVAPWMGGWITKALL